MSGKRGRRQVTRQENLGEISESHVHSQSLFPEHLGTCHTTRLACEEQSPGFSSAVLGRERSRTPKETQACELRGHPLPAWLHQHWLQKPLTAQEDPVILENYQRFVSELAGEAQSRQFVPQFLTLSFYPLQTVFYSSVCTEPVWAFSRGIIATKVDWPHSSRRFHPYNPKDGRIGLLTSCSQI